MKNNIGTSGIGWDDKLQAWFVKLDNKRCEVEGCSGCENLEHREMYSYQPARTSCSKGHDGTIISANFYSLLKNGVRDQVASIFRQPDGDCEDYKSGGKAE